MEWFDQTLKNILQKSATKEGKDWDKLLPYLLLVYREVPQTSTQGFFRFSYCMDGQCENRWIFCSMYGKVLPVVRQCCFPHIVNEGEIITKSKPVHKNLTNAQAKQKQWYDKSTKSRNFSKGDQVMVLLPTDTNKLIPQ